MDFTSIASCFRFIMPIFNYLFPETPVDEKSIPEFSSADIAWMLVSSAMVLIMTPGLGFFYGGMVRKKNVISTILKALLQWV